MSRKNSNRISKPDQFKNANVYVVVDHAGRTLKVITNLGKAYQSAFVDSNAAGVQFWNAGTGELVGVVMKDGRTLNAKQLEKHQFHGEGEVEAIIPVR